MAANQTALSQRIAEQLKPVFADLGLALDSFIVENLSLPDELQKRLDERIGMGMVGDMGRYTQFQVAQSVPIAAGNEGAGGTAGVGAGLGAGLAMAQAMMNAVRPPGAAPSGGAPPAGPEAGPPPSGAPPATPGAAPETAAGAETKFCLNCGEPIPRKAKFCPECGEAQQ
jgi:membrane protease subunit (stomatin/prohibitin family)